MCCLLGALVVLGSILITLPTLAGVVPLELVTTDATIHGGPADPAKAATDTVVLIGPHGSGALHNGQFESSGGGPNWQGWTSRDMTLSSGNAWHISTYHAEGLNGHGPGNHALWCGSLDFPSCAPDDEDGGYGNNYFEIVDWFGTVADPGEPCNVGIEAWLNHDLESGYDYLTLTAILADGSSSELFSADGQATNRQLQASITYGAEDYVGESSNQVHLRFLVASDGGWSDEDCQAYGIGACQIDDITISLSNGSVVDLSDFEGDSMGAWVRGEVPYVGNFARLWTRLRDNDPCLNNWSPQVAFIDDGLVVPGTGGTTCLDWCYGPSGYIINHSGGLAGPDFHLHNLVLSPAVDISHLDSPVLLLEFDYYSHFYLSQDDPGIYPTYSVRSTVSNNPDDLENAPWSSDLVITNREGYYRFTEFISSLVDPEATFVQVALGVNEFGWMYGYIGGNGTPSPYFDNVRLSAVTAGGPYLSASEFKLAQDAFPESGQVDLVNPGTNNVRFDMATSQPAAGQPLTIAGDSIVCEVTPARNGATLYGRPRLHYILKANPVFDPYRTSGMPDVWVVEGQNVVYSGGFISANQFAFDLPDTGFLFPGDQLHYFLSATDYLPGSYNTSLLPADTTGFSNFSSPLDYDPLFTVRALPAIASQDDVLSQSAAVLFWNDGGHAGLGQWYSALLNCNLTAGENCDVYFTNSPGSDCGNGLGQKATAAQLAGYSTILYSSGSYDNTMVEADTQVLAQWLALWDKHLFTTGDNLARDLNSTSPSTTLFLTDYLGLSLSADDVRPSINNQSAPVVLSEIGNPVLQADLSWIAYGHCPDLNTFSGVIPQSGSVKLASFTNANGTPDYAFSAATLCTNYGQVISMPFDLQFIRTNPSDHGNPYQMPTRTWILWQVLAYFSDLNPSPPVGAHQAMGLTAENHPNPFNISTTIYFVLPKEAHLSIKIYDVSGQLVSTLVNEQYKSGPGHAVWSGTDDQDRAVSSGVYFYKVKFDGEVLVQKMVLIK